MSIPPAEHAALLIAHYLKHLTERAGLRWTDANDRDMQTLAQLLDQGEVEAAESIPPYERPIISDRVTQVFEHEPIAVDPEWEKFQRWRAMRAEEERYAQTRRLVRRT